MGIGMRVWGYGGYGWYQSVAILRLMLDGVVGAVGVVDLVAGIGIEMGWIGCALLLCPLYSLLYALCCCCVFMVLYHALGYHIVQYCAMLCYAVCAVWCFRHFFFLSPHPTYLGIYMYCGFTCGWV